MKPPCMNFESVVARTLVITSLDLCLFILWKYFLLLFISFLSAGATESMQMPSIISKTLRKPAMTYQGSFDLPPVALGEWLET